MTNPQPQPVNKNWRVVEQVAKNLSENEARTMLKDFESDGNTCYYAESTLHEYIESASGPITVGRPEPLL